MIDKGSLVYSALAGHLQMGTVTSRRVGKDKWAYYEVKWHNNEKYESILSNYKSINPNSVPPERKEYRAGEIYELTAIDVASSINEHLDFLHSSNSVVENG
jgi:hypothetical protein